MVSKGEIGLALFIVLYPILCISADMENKNTFSKMTNDEICQFIDSKEGNVPGFTKRGNYDRKALEMRAYNRMNRQTKQVGV